MASAALVTTAVGSGALREVVPAIATGMQQRRELNAEHPLNVIACANFLDNSRVLRDYVYGDLWALDSRYARRAAGFPVCVVDRIIPGAPVTRPGEDPLAVVVGQAFEFVVGSDAVVGPPPPVRGMVLSDRIHAHSEGKLFTLNTAHAIAAYLGYQRGHAYIHTRSVIMARAVLSPARWSSRRRCCYDATGLIQNGAHRIAWPE